MSTPPPYGQPPPGGQPPYGQPPYSQPTGSSNATLILVLGIMSFIVCGPILGPIAWIMGKNALASGTLNPSEVGTVNAGRICGMVATILSLVGIVLYAVLIAFGVASGLGHPHSTYSTP